jgi:hypothetical protein
MLLLHTSILNVPSLFTPLLTSFLSFATMHLLHTKDFPQNCIPNAFPTTTTLSNSMVVDSTCNLISCFILDLNMCNNFVNNCENTIQCDLIPVCILASPLLRILMLLLITSLLGSLLMLKLVVMLSVMIL